VGTVHTEINTAQTAHTPGKPCGDVVRTMISERGMIVVLADGIRSGVRAQLAAESCAAQILCYLENGDSLRKTAVRLRHVMEQNRAPDQPFAAFIVAQLRTDGVCTAVTYDIPPPLYLSGNSATVLDPVSVSEPRLAEFRIKLEPGESILLVSDGITESGRGQAGLRVWSIAGVEDFCSDHLAARLPVKELPHELVREAVFRDRDGHDDCTAVLLHTRPSQNLVILTGPPVRPEDDIKFVQRFQKIPAGQKVICGGTTASIFARETGQSIQPTPESPSRFTPPGMDLQGADLVTEGVVTLNQAYNLFDEDLEFWEEENPAVNLCRKLQTADRIHILTGAARNKNNLTAHSKQLGMISRQDILELLTKKLKSAGKIVIVEPA